MMEFEALSSHSPCWPACVRCCQVEKEWIVFFTFAQRKYLKEIPASQACAHEMLNVEGAQEVGKNLLRG